jgi:hypothetical protein
LELPDGHKQPEQTSVKGHDRIWNEFKLHQVDDGYFELYHVDSDSQLREFLQTRRCEFRSGWAYYEFKNEVEHVSEDKQLVFMKVSSLKSN